GRDRRARRPHPARRARDRRRRPPDPLRGHRGQRGVRDALRGGKSMTPKGIFYVFAHVSDLARSKEFYGGTLAGKPPHDEKDVAGFAFGAAYLGLHADPRGEAARYVGGMHVAVQVDDAAAEHARLAKAGVRVTALLDQPWGERSFTFDDPDGYLWSFGEA